MQAFPGRMAGLYSSGSAVTPLVQTVAAAEGSAGSTLPASRVVLEPASGFDVEHEPFFIPPSIHASRILISAFPRFPSGGIGLSADFMRASASSATLFDGSNPDGAVSCSQVMIVSPAP